MNKYYNTLIDSIKQYGIHSIFVKNFVLISIIIIIPLLSLCIVLYTKFSEDFSDTLNTLHSENITQLQQNLDTVFFETETLSNLLITHTNINDFLLLDFNTKTYDSIEKAQSICSLLNIAASTNTYINSIYVYSQKNNYLLTSSYQNGSIDNIFDKEWLHEYSLNKNLNVSYTVRNMPNSNDRIFSLFKYIRDDLDNTLGCIIININIDNMCKSINPQNSFIPLSDIYIVNEDKTVLFSFLSDAINTPLTEFPPYEDVYDWDDGKKGDDFTILSRASKYYPLKIIIIANSLVFNKELNTLKLWLLLITLISVLIAIIISVIVSIRTFIPLNNIILNLSENSQIAKKSNSKNEYFYILNQINKTYTDNQNLSIALEKHLSELQQSQIIALQTQINPHFLYNSLESIKWEAIKLTDSQNNVSSMIQKLSTLFRLSFNFPSEFISVHDEIEHAKCYIDLQKIRFGERFDVHWNIDRQALNCKTEKIILQPLIENAITHGIKPMSGKGLIIVNILFQHEYISFEIVDNGIGMPEDKLKIIRKNLSEIETYQLDSSKDIGILNIVKRLFLVYGNNFKFEINHNTPNGTIIKIIIPSI